MGEVIHAYASMITTFANFLFTLNFSDGVNVGGFILACSVLSIIIRFLFRQIQAAPVTFKSDLSTRQQRADMEYKKSYDYYKENRIRQESYDSKYRYGF